MEKYGFIVNEDFKNQVLNDSLKFISGVKKLREKDSFYKRRSEFAALTREGFNMCQIAQKFGISRQAVSLALQKAVKEGQVVHKTRANTNDSPNYKIISRKKFKEVICTECGETFSTDRKRKTCSKECMAKSKQKTFGGEWSRVSFLELLCKGCGKNFKRSKYLHKINQSKRNAKSNYYCSRQCYCSTRASSNPTTTVISSTNV